MSENKAVKQKKPSVLIQFIGSMNLAVTLLVMLAIASVIGTVLKQGEAYQDYIIKFGPFWSHVFNSLGLFHVYGAAWFMLVLLFLLTSTATCLVRNTPKFLKDMKQYSETMSITAYKHQPYSETFSVENFDEALAKQTLEEQGYKTKVHHAENGDVTVAGMKGRWSRLGYIFAHTSIIVICVGALFDSDLLLKYRQLTGHLAAETRSIPLDQIPKKSWLGPNNFSFRGTVNVAEGQSTDVLFLPYGQGFLVQKLPFSIHVNQFRIKYYDTGMPKSFESDVVLTAPDLKKPITKTIKVNHPLVYKNYSIYQSSFGDGGTKLKLAIHPLRSPYPNALNISTAVNQVEPLKTPIGTFKAEFNDFKMFNIVPATEEEKKATGKKMHNNGPSIVFKVRDDQGKAWEYKNFMQPNEQEGRWFFMTGVRTTPAAPYRYLFIPADDKRSKKRFFEFLALLNNPVLIKKYLAEVVPKSPNVDAKTYSLQMRLLQQLMVLFRDRGFKGIDMFIQQKVPKAEQKKVRDYYLGQTSYALQMLYLELLKKQGGEKNLTGNGLSKFDKQWFEDALNAINALPNYGPPMYFEVKSFKQINATGLQITKSPGKDVVFLGSGMLIIGVFILFYIRQKRVWLAYSKQENALTVAGKDRKDLPETQIEFDQLLDSVKSNLKVS